jgi:hypothetical protein
MGLDSMIFLLDKLMNLGYWTITFTCTFSQREL